jgi:glucose-1-phosphate thymidylyltransferase
VKPISRAVILARGLGTRMRRAAEGTAIGDEQARVADTGVKAMIPIGRPFLDYVLSALADAGITDVCLVIGPEHQRIRDYYETEVVPARLRVTVAIQERPLGTADAVLAAEAFAAGEHFLVLNSDNYYPVEAYAALVASGSAALPGFDREALVKESNIDPERIRSFALLRVAADGTLEDIVEKPDAATFERMGPHALVSMNLWAFPPEIFAACRAISPSARGELELPDAVRLAIGQLGARFRVIPCRAGVLDLSSRGDIAAVAEALKGVEVRL